MGRLKQHRVRTIEDVFNETVLVTPHTGKRHIDMPEWRRRGYKPLFLDLTAESRAIVASTLVAEGRIDPEDDLDAFWLHVALTRAIGRGHASPEAIEFHQQTCAAHPRWR